MPRQFKFGHASFHLGWRFFPIDCPMEVDIPGIGLAPWRDAGDLKTIRSSDRDLVPFPRLFQVYRKESLTPFFRQFVSIPRITALRYFDQFPEIVLHAACD